MSKVKCVHCDTENDPEQSAGYCDECGKKLPGIYVPPRPSSATKDESPAVRTAPASGRQVPPAAIGIFLGLAGGLLAIGTVLQFLLPFALVGAAVCGFLACLLGVLASPVKLLEMSHLIGTKNPKTARIVCFVGLFVFLLGTVGASVWVVEIWSQMRK